MNGPGGQPVPQRIGKYEIVNVLGQGGMGLVYRARDARIGRDVAIKTLTAEGFSGNPDLLKRFYLEAGHTGNLRHPNIVTVYDFGDDEGIPYIVMEFLDGEPLDKIIREKSPLHMSVKLEIIEQVCSALAYAHVQGMIHRDVKPANVIVQRDGLVKLLDFGIARTGGNDDTAVTRTGTLVGTPAYISPERLKGESFDGRADIFSTGVMLYQLLTGALPFDAEYPAILHQILQEEAPPLGKYLQEVPSQLDQVISKALAKDPQVRYGRADDMGADLNTVGAQLKSQRIAEMLSDARTAVAAQEFGDARRLLSQVLRLDSRNADAKQLMTGVDEHFTQQRIRQRVEQLKKFAEESMATRNWEQAISVCDEALQLEPGNPAMADLQEKARSGKQTKEQIQRLLREADTARQAGKYESARDFAEKAFNLDPDDSRIMNICKVLRQEAEDDRRKVQVRQLLQKAQESLTACRLLEASSAISEAESLGTADVELMRLKDELAEAIAREEQKGLVSALEDKVGLALTFEQVQAAMGEVTAALERYPTEATLLRLRMELEPRFREHEKKHLIADVSDACKRLAPNEALTQVREALTKLPGNTSLLKLETTITKRLTRQQRDQMLKDYLAKARDLLEDHLYLETVKVLELAEKDGFSSPEMAALQNMARSAAAERVSQDLVERSFLEAKRLLEEQDYEAVLRLLPPVLERVDEPGLRRQLDEASQKLREIDARVEQVTAEVDRLCGMELFDAAMGLIRSEPPGVKQSKRLQAALETSRALMEAEAARLESLGAVYSALSTPECGAMYQRIAQSGIAPLPGTAEMERRLGLRLRAIADQQLSKCIEEARQALTAEDPGSAENLVESAAEWQASASPELQAEWKNVQTETAAAKKVLRFRKVLRR